MKLSIITINYNNKTGLEKTMQSVLQQTATDFEYILIDGASTDGSREVIEQYATNPEHSKKITYWVSEKNTGIYNAMNKGIKQAKGEFCLFLNSGDWLVENTTLEKVLLELNSTNTIYYCDVNCEEKITRYPDFVDVNYFISNIINHQATFIPHNLFGKYGYYNETYFICSDWLFFLKTSYLNEAGFVHLPLVATNFTLGGISTISKYTNLHNTERQKVFLEVFGNLAPTIIDIEDFRKSIYGTTIKLVGKNSKFYNFYLQVFRYFARRLIKK